LETAPITDEEMQLAIDALQAGALNASGIALYYANLRIERRAQQVLDALVAEGTVRRDSEHVYKITGGPA